jgi:hypothetical protein
LGDDDDDYASSAIRTSAATHATAQQPSHLVQRCEGGAVPLRWTPTAFVVRDRGFARFCSNTTT